MTQFYYKEFVMALKVLLMNKYPNICPTFVEYNHVKSVESS